MADATIYHLAPLSELRAGCGADEYTPARFAADGFVHCTEAPESVLEVARDYFADIAEELAVVRIDASRLRARLVYEAPAPISGGGTLHLRPGALFPHLYGPLNLDAVTGIGLLQRRGAGFVWPERFQPASSLLVNDP